MALAPKSVIVNGSPCVCSQLHGPDVRPGALVKQRTGRRAFKVVCLDGDEAVLRNLRYPDKVVAVSAAAMCADFVKIEPLGSDCESPVPEGAGLPGARG